MRLVDIRHITVRDGALDLEVAVEITKMVDAVVAKRILDILPNLSRHVCVNGRGDSFGDEIEGTEVAHLLEHVIIELQGQTYGEASFKGHTSRLDGFADDRDEKIVLMRTTVTFQDDLVALRAVEQARVLVEWALDPATGSFPDMNTMRNELQGMME